MADRVPYLVTRLQDHATTIFAEMSALAVATGSINLGQGFPDTDGPAAIAEAAVAAIRGGHNQYPPGDGIPELRRAVAAHQSTEYGLSYDPEGEVLVTAGATEAVTAAVLSLCEPGDEVVMFEPFYDSYAASVAIAGATRRVIRLRAPDWTFDPEDLRRVVNGRTRMLLLNTPHNPTGKVFSAEELATLAQWCVEHDLLVVTDEVYEHLVFEGWHLPLAGFPGMRERTVTVSSAGKTFAFTGWKVGWACAPAPLLAAVRAVKQFLTYVNAGPFQYAIAQALASGPEYFGSVASKLRSSRDRFCAGLEAVGFDVRPPAATYFVMTDITSIGETDAVEFCRELPSRCGVVAVPGPAFYEDPEAARSLVRWAFCKRDTVLDDALSRLGMLASVHTDREQ